MATKLAFTNLDVFTSTRFLGNPLAIVRIPSDLEGGLTQSQKQIIAREFNFSETVFLHETSDADSPVTIDIFTPTRELPFAGHPTVGSGWYLLSRNPTRESVTLRTKAGNIPVVKADGGKVRIEVPTDFKVHASHPLPEFKAQQTRLSGSDYIFGADGAEPVVSIVKGMTFYLVEVASEDALSRLQLTSQQFELSDSHLGEWQGFVGLYAFYQTKDGVVRTRLFSDGIEDPATGSAASTLGGWLAQKRGEGSHQISIVQGVEMGRRSEIEVSVDIGSDKKIQKIQLAGGAVEVMEGTVFSQ
ncbi:putative isomerase [Psilocybe cubensis]|uniref:Isomerase n=2 Tax=Psilocybe cubensis TaxID=181762 RepID=A0ACB8GK22_PSICU|nr:putative isomerase [Psilocybe cubensis]KAH9476065.1 putative isomerase [Psilocybe cubensis]